ncbi:ABC transporter ATP-binding protein/permease, partial [Flavobacteriaceae bacterium]|nr:ABC transporter ATP-binding protein/permease [Flavobacteriaceae bacterium]
LLMDPKIIEDIPLLVIIKNSLPETSHFTFLLLFFGGITCVFFLKSVFLVFLSFKQNRFLANVSASISNNLFSNYLNQPYSFHLKRNASELIKNIQVEINYVHTFLLSFMTLFIEGGFIFSILLTLVFIEPIGAVSIGLFYSLLSLVFFKLTKKKLIQWGELRKDLDADVTKIALEGLGGIKDLLILGKTNFFIEQYSKKNYSKARLNSNQGMVSQMPRFYLELISIVGLVSFIFIMLFQGRDTTTLITVLGVFVAGTFRMIPSLNKIIAARQAMKYYLPSVNIIYNELLNFNTSNALDTKNSKFRFQKFIEYKNVSFGFNKEQIILKNINFKFQKGQIVGVIGESGSGKSTLIDLLLGLYEPTSGTILVDGIENEQLNHYWRNNIGYVSQSIYLTDDTIKNNIAFGVPHSQINESKIDKLLKEVQLDKFVSDLKDGFNTKVGERGVQLSGGQIQRIGIARALYNNPEILILDEATSALDEVTEKEILKSINILKGEKTIIMIAHRLSTLENCDCIFEVINSSLILK